MNHNFPEPAKGLGQPVKRRALLKQFGVGVAGLALACFGGSSGFTGRSDN